MPMPLTVIQGDITKLAVDAIVNAANEGLLAGGGVCGAIFRAAGPGLAEACRKVAPCPAGEVRITPGFALPARFILHAVGPVWNGGRMNEDALLASCYRRSIELAAEHGVARIAFPAISTGIYGFPPDRAAPIAVGASADALRAHPSVTEVIFCCFDAASADRHRAAIAAMRA
jgi:O-acetyl-ADP-ribose deacetylase (regulator of RNase III)